MAEAVFKHKVEELGYSRYFKLIDSFGTSGWHMGDSPDSRSARTCRKHGVAVNHCSQQISPLDFHRFDYIIGMDESNVEDLQFMKPKGSNAVVAMFGKWRRDKQFDEVISDPYYGGSGGFEYNFKQISHFCEVFLNEEVKK